MRSKNLVPVQVILPQSQMRSNHSAPRGAFEEALQSSIEASLRSSGAGPTLRIFSALYHRTKPQSDDDRPGPSSALTHNSLLPPPDNGDTAIDIKPDISDLNRELSRRGGGVDETTDQARPDASSTPSVRTSSVHSAVSPRDQQVEASFTSTMRGPPPLLLPQSFLRSTTTTTNNDQTTYSNNANRHVLQRPPSLLPKNLQIEQLKQAQEQVKQLQQYQRWHLLQQRHQQARVAANSLSLPRLPLFNPLMPTSAFNRSALINPGSAINGSHALSQESTGAVGQPSPGSPMFRKGFCKGGKDIRLSTLARDGTRITPYSTEYTLIAMSISPSVPQIVKSPGSYHPPDIPSEAMVVVAVSVKCLPPQQHELSRPLLAKCIGCGDISLHTFATLSSHINLRTVSPSHTNISLSGVNPLQRHARNFILRDPNLPHGCIRGAIIPWQSSDITPPRLPSSVVLPVLPTGAAPHRPRTGPLLQQLQPQLKYKPPSDNRITPTMIQTRPHFLPPTGVSISHRDLVNKPQLITSSVQPIVLDNSPSAENTQKEHNLAAEWSPISSGQSDRSPLASDVLTQPRHDPDWNSTVKLPEKLPNYVGRPLILICWEWQQLQSNIQNVHINRSYIKCFEDAAVECHNSAVMPLSREMCYLVTAQYLASLEKHEFPTPSSLSAWLGRSRLMLASMRQIQLTMPHVMALVRMTIGNCMHKIGLVISQISQAHAINECIANLRPTGPSYHIVAHISSDAILDLSILSTGHTSRLMREYFHTFDECSEMIQQNVTSETIDTIDDKISAYHLGECLTALSSEARKSLYSIRTSFVLAFHRESSTSSPILTSSAKKFVRDPKHYSTSTGSNVQCPITSDENNNTKEISPAEEASTAHFVAKKLFSHVSSLCEDHAKLDLSHFSSIQCCFLLPPSPVSRSETIADVTASGVLQELRTCASPTPTTVDLRKIIFTASLKSKQRFRALCEHIKINSSTLFVIFCLDAHLHCETNSVGSEWMSTLSNELMPICRNILIVSSSHIPHALLNQNSSIPSDNVLFCNPKSANASLFNHCLTPEEISASVNLDLKYENETVSTLDSLPQILSAPVNARVLMQAYIAALAICVSSHQTLTTGESCLQNEEKLQNLTSPVTISVVRDLISSKSGITVILRVPSEILAAKIASDLTNAREKLMMQKAFEIMLYASHTKPQLSDYFLQLVKTHKEKPDDWEPENLSEIDCIPLLIIYAGKDITNHLMPRNLRYVDLRLIDNNLESLTHSSILSEMSLAQPQAQMEFQPTESVPNRTSYEPPTKKTKRESEDEALKMDTFSEDSGSGSENKLKWKSFDGKEEEVKEFSDEENEAVDNESKNLNRKRALSSEEKTGSKTDKSTYTSVPKIILARNILSCVQSHLNGTQKFMDLPTHSNCEWSSHARPIINEKLTDNQMAEYIRKWSKALPAHPNCVDQDDQVTKETPRSILLVTPPRMRVSLACCLFMKELNRILVKLLQVEVYDYKSSSAIKPYYPLPNVDLLPQWPVHTTILDMDFDTSVRNSTVTNASQITNGIKDFDPETVAEGAVSASPCMAGKLCAFDVNHQACDICRSLRAFQNTTVHQMSIPNCGIGQQCVRDGTQPLDVTFIIPETHRHQFVFQHREDSKPKVLAINLRFKEHTGVKTPVFSLAISGAQHGLYNLGHVLSNSGKPSIPHPDDLKIDEGPKSPDPLHVVVLRHSDVDEFKTMWTNSTLMVLPDNFDDLGMGAMKYVVQCVMQHSVSVRQEQHNAFQESSTNGDVWPFALLLDDSAVLWTSCNAEESISSSPDNLIESSRSKVWKHISLLDVLERIEAVPCVEKYAAIGIRPWSSEMEIPKCEEEFSGDVVCSSFSKCHLTSCYAINTTLTKDELFDFSKFLHNDIDWCMRVAAADLPLFRFNDVAVATKVMSSSTSRKELTSVACEDPKTLVSLADSEYKPLAHHPQLLLETFLAHLGHTVFPKARSNSRHPVLVVDRYISLGPEVYVEFVSSKTDTSPLATDTEKTFSGLLLYCQSNEMSLNFLQQFQFSTGATVCVVGRDRSSLRQTVVNLHLENDWHFRLTDEYQTTNNTSKRKPLFYLTGVARSSR